jgi:hypothetical protein
LKLENFSLEGDSAVVIAALQSPALSQDWHIDPLIASTLSMLPATALWVAKKVHRSANFCAHHVAFWAAARVSQAAFPLILLPLPLILFVVEKIHLL